MDIRKFFNKRLKTDHVKDGIDSQCNDLTTDNVQINCSSSIAAPEQSINITNVANVGLQAVCSLPSTSTQTTSSKPNTNVYVNDSFDIGNCLDNTPTNNDLMYLMLTKTWKPDVSYNFKNDVMEGKRPFLREWLNTYPWLAYSQTGKGALCKSCVLFKPRVSHGSYQSGFITRPFNNNHKKFHEHAKSHALSQWHREAVEKSSNFLSVMNSEKKSVDVLVNQGLAHQIQSNRNKLKPILSSILFCATHDLPLRGKKDSQAVFNDLLHFREESGDVTLADHLKTAPKNASYISHRVQNELIEITATVLRNELVDKIHLNEVFSILADETMDVSGVEQLSLGVRYVDMTEKCIKEDFLGFTPLQDGLGAESVASAITSTLKAWGLNLNKVVGQGYDGCSTMAGHLTGVHKRISEEFPAALYFHCSSHKLNLVVNDLNNLPQVRNTVGTIKEVIKFFRENGQRRAIVGTLQKLCETRWTEKYKAIRKFSEQFVDIVQALDTLSLEGNKDTRQKAFQLHCAVTATSFFICMQIIAVYSSKLEIVTQMLQGPSVDLLRVSAHIQRLVGIFKTDRLNSVKEFDKIMVTVEQNAAALGVTLSKPRVISGKQAHRSNQPSETISDYFRVSIFLPYLDSLIQSLSERFSEKNQPAFEIFNLHPKVMKTLSKENYESSMIKVAELYAKLLKNFKDESTLWYDLWTNTEIDSKDLEKMHLLDVLQHEHVYFLPSVARAIQIALCLPPTTCTIERSFR